MGTTYEQHDQDKLATWRTSLRVPTLALAYIQQERRRAGFSLQGCSAQVAFIFFFYFVLKRVLRRFCAGLVQRQTSSDIVITESGHSSVVTRWTIDQEVVGSNPTHGGNLISVVRSLTGFTQPIR